MNTQSPAPAIFQRAMDTFPDGSERPVAFASRTLNSSEKNYSQIEKEALSLVYGIKKFHQYIYGRRFTLVTDHQLLVSILGPKKGIPPLAAARMQRWTLILSAYSYDISYRATGAHANADGLSRLPLKTLSVVPSSEQSILNVLQIKALPCKGRQRSYRISCVKQGTSLFEGRLASRSA